jgi:hypothetical protein
MTRSLSAGCFVLLAMMSTQAAARTRLTDNFDTENGGVAALNYANFRNFNVTGYVDLIGNGTNDLYPGHGLYVDMCGSASSCGTLTTKAKFPAGSYIFTLKLAGNDRQDAPDGVQVTFGAFSHTYMAKAYNKPFTATGTVTLTAPAAFSVGDLGLINVDQGTILYSVKITPAP